MLNGKWYYYENEVALKAQWRKDSVGWCWLGADGAMATNQWVKDSKGWCYVEASGYCATNCWKKDSVGWVWLDSEGSMTKNAWVQDGGSWYYLDDQGYMLSNCYKVIDGKIYRLREDGKMMANTQFNGGYIGADGVIGEDCFAYILGNDTRALQREVAYANVVAGGIRVYMSEYEGLCVATCIYYRIGNYQSLFEYEVMRVIEKDIVIKDPDTYFSKKISNAFGNTKLYYIGLRNEFTEQTIIISKDILYN